MTVLGVTATAAGGAVATPSDASAHAQVSGSSAGSWWGWWDDDNDDDGDDDSSDRWSWWGSGSWWQDSPWWKDDGDDETGGDDGTDQPEPPNFDVSGVSSNSPVTEGETVTVTGTVENTGGREATQTVDFSVDGVSDSQSVTLAAGASQQVSFEWTTAAGDAGEYTASVESANDSATSTVSVEAPEPEPQPDPATFGVSISGTNSPVVAGTTLTVDATVENTGGQQGTQTVALAVDGSTVDSQSTTLAAGESSTVTLSWTTASGDAGDHTAAVSTANASAQTTVTVEEPAPEPEPASFDVAGVSSNSPVTEGDALDVSATVTNTGGQQGTQTVALAVDGSTVDSQSVTLASGASQQVTLSWTTATGDAGTHDLTVSSDNASATGTATVEEPAAPANFDVAGVSSNSPVTEGDQLDVSATVTNTGDLEGTQTVSLSVDGSTVDSQSVTLAGGASQQVTLSWTTATGDAGTHDLTVSSDDGSATGTATVEEPAAPANFGLSGVSSNSPVTEGDQLDVSTTVTNSGDLEGTQTVELTVGGTVRDSQTVTLGPGESQSITLSWTTADGDAGDYTATASSADDSGSTSVSVESAVTIPSSFTATLEDGYIQLGTGSDAYKINLTECPNGEAPSSDVSCQWAEATVDQETGDFTIAREDLHFNTSIYVQQLATNVTVQMTAPNGLSGQTDWETGSSTLNGDLDVVVPQFADTCGAGVTISATTGTDDPLTGSQFDVADGAPATGTLVDSTFSVPAVTGCGTVAGGLVDLNTVANSQLGLPSSSGNNRLKMDLYLEYDG